MTGVRLHHSNRLEVLAAELAHLMRTDPGDPFAPERIVVPHPTIGRWLSLEIAREIGIAANVRYEQPAEFAWSIMRGVVPELSREQPYEPARLRWRIHDLLPGSAAEPGERTAGSEPARAPPGVSGADGGARALEGAVGGYLRDGDSRKRLELADRLARMYDQCLLYRPDWIREWESGSAPHWQAQLWQRVVGTDGAGGTDHWVGALEKFRRKLRNSRRASATEDGSAAHGDRAPPAPPDRSATANDAASARASESPPRGEPSARSPRPHADAPSSSVEDSLLPSDWPRRASFFAVPALSPSYLELLCEAARGIEIHLFVLNPCREYWGDIHSRREIDHRAEGEDPDAGYFTEGNELLAAWGRAGRDMIDALVEVPGADWEERFVEPTSAGRLAAVQRDILDLRLASEAARDDGLLIAGPVAASVTEAPGVATPADRPDGLAPHAGASRADRSDGVAPDAGASPAGRPDGPAPDVGTSPAAEPGADPGAFRATPPHAGPNPRPPVEAQRPVTDDSIQIHVCHSPVREAEVLHDRLLAVFDAHPDLEPADVLVLTPDLETYGPAVGAVFAAAGRIPCHVARARAVESRTLRAFLDLLALPSSRHGAETVLAPLAAPAIGVRFGIGDTDVATIRGWVREAGIRWGVDEAHRGEEDLPETADHTWRHGLRRLLLGYAMADADEPVAGLVPCRGAQGGFGFGEMDGELLGRFVSYCEQVFGLRARLGGRRPPARWGAVLRDVVRDFLSDGSERVRGAGGPEGWAFARELAEESAAVRALIRDFENEASHARTPVPLEVVLDVLRERADQTAREVARLADGVTVAGMGAGRIVPAGAVCVVGMNDGVFPRSPSTPSFDVVAAGRARRGDRDIRREDRFAFLEALLAARRCFLVTYAGRGLRDDAPIPPSVLVDELKDYLGRRFPGETFETRHPLQPFSPRYFEAAGPRVQDAAPPGSVGPADDTARGAQGDWQRDKEDWTGAGVRDGAEKATQTEGRAPGAEADGVSHATPESAANSRTASPAGAVAAGSGDDAAARARNGEIGRAPGTGPGGAVVDGGAPETTGATPVAPGGATRAAEGLFSYSRGMCEAAKVVRAETAASETRSRFAGVALPAPDADRHCVDLADLIAFFANPTRCFLRDRLGVRLELDDLTLEDEEPFELDNLELHRLRCDIWDQMQAGIRPERGAALLHGSGRLPQAGLGRIVHGWAREEVEPLEGLLAPHRKALDAQPRPVDVELGGFRVVGVVEHVDPSVEGSNGAESSGTEAGETEPDRMVWWRMGGLRARDRIGIWLRQLAWAAAGHGPLEAVVVWRERGLWKSAAFPPPDDAREQLGRWLDAWWQGLAAPLPFFPETSFAFAKAIASVPDDGDAIPEPVLEAAREKAYVAWLGNPYQPGPAERSDLYRALIHDTDDPLAGGFEDLAAKLLVALARTQA